MSARDDYWYPICGGDVDTEQWAAMCDEIDRLRSDLAEALHALNLLARDCDRLNSSEFTRYAFRDPASGEFSDCYSRPHSVDGYWWEIACQPLRSLDSGRVKA